MDKITLLRAMPGVLFAKRWTVDGIKGYDKARYVYVKEEDVNCIHTLASVLRKHETKPDVCSIRGMKVSLDDAKALGTLPDLAGGEPLPAVKMSGRSYAYLRRKGIFVDQAHHWVCLDGDTFRPVKTADDLLTRPENCVAEFLLTLPEPFQTATCYWQLSNSHGAVGNEGLLKVHLWFWMAKARTGAELLAYAESTGMDKLIDITLFRTVQVHYIAAPVIDDGVVCPVVERSGLLPGLMGDEVELDVTAGMLVRVRPERDGLAGGLWDDGDAPVDPGSKGGLVGAFCRCYGTLADVMAQDWAEDLGFSPDDGSDRRWTWGGGGGGAVGGAWVADGPAGGQWVGNSHATDPCAGRLVNMYDLVRRHRYGDLDSAVSVEDQWTLEADVRSRPSEAAMRAWCRTLPEVRAELEAAEVEAERLADEAAVAGGDVDSNDTLGGGGDALLDAKWFARMLKKMESRLMGAGCTEDDVHGLLRVAQVQEAWRNVFFRASSGRLYLLNRAGVLVNFIQADWQAQVQEAFGRFLDKFLLPVVAARIVSGRQAGPKNNVGEVSKELNGAAFGAFAAYVKAYRQRETLGIEVDIFTDRSSITMPNPDLARITYAHTEFMVETATVGADIEELVLADYREHVPELDEIVDFLVYARFASDRRKAFCLWKALAGWGKGLLWNAVLGRDGLGIVTEMSMKEVESAMEGKPSGLSASDFHGSWVLWADEFRAPKAEMKQLNSSIFISPKGQPRIQVSLYAKVMTTAEEIPSLMGEHGVEDQFASRLMFYRHDGTDDTGAINIEARPVYQHVTSVEYIRVLRRWFAAQLNERVALMRELGQDESAKVANAGLADLHSRRGIAAGKKTLNQHVPEMAAELTVLIKDWARAKHPVDSFVDTEGTAYLDTLPGALRSVLGMNVRTIVGARSVGDIDTRSEAWVTVKHAMSVVKVWIDATMDVSERVSVRHKAGEIAKSIGEVPYTEPYRLWMKDKSEVKQKGLLIHLWDAAERKRRKLIPDEGGNVLNFPT